MPANKKFNISGKELLSISGVELSSDEALYNIKNVSIDTRTIKPGDLFIAIKGERFDGHKFIRQAVEKGAKYCAVEKEYKADPEDAGVPLIYTDNTTKFLGELAALRRKKLSAVVIAVTGSNGKTTTKDILSELLKTTFRTVSTNANDNNHIGVPLTIFRCTPSTEMLVLEMGTNHFGEIPYSAAIGAPDISLITCIGDSHLEFLKNRKGVLQEKKAIFDAAEKNSGLIVLNIDDPYLVKLKSKYTNVITVSSSGKADYTVKSKPVVNSVLRKAEFKNKNLQMDVVLPLAGEHNVKNTLMAAAIAHHCGVSKTNILKGLKKVRAPKHRLNIIKRGKTTIIDDTYNANPGSMEAALKILSDIKTPLNKIAVLGDMFELGESSTKVHKALAAGIKQLDISEILVTGEAMKHMFDAFKDRDKTIVYFEQPEMLKKYLSAIRKEPAVYLFKGSRGMKMEQYINNITGK